MKARFKWTALVLGSCAIALGAPKLARSADHLDGPAVTTDPATDINDLYSWMDGSRAVFALTVHPAASAASKFSDAALYVIHTMSAPSFGAAGTNLDIICSFDAAQAIQCWLGNSKYVKGDASKAEGLATTDGAFRVFAGLRKDPFFFNLEGYNAVRTAVIGAAGGLTFDAGCPNIPPATADALAGNLAKSPDGGAPRDFFENLNTLSIVVSVDKALVTTGGPVVSAWASTNRKP